MPSTFSGKVTFKNGAAAQNVQVRIFDKDAPGKGDDNLTLTPGLSDKQGKFIVKYDPSLYQDIINLSFLNMRIGSDEKGIKVPDLFDIYSPYLEFRWSMDSENYTHTAPLEWLKDHFELPYSTRFSFLPSQHGFRFPNAFSGYMLPFNMPFLSDSKVKSVYGLCGGMSAGAIDFLLAGREIPATEIAPKRGTRLHRYLFQRAMDSFAMGESILRFARWMLLPNEGVNGTYHLTLLEWQKIRRALDEMRLVPIGQLRAKSSHFQEVTRDVWNNHQVMAYGYQTHPDGAIDIQIYDPNCPKVDNAVIHAKQLQVGEENGQPVYGLMCYETDCWEERRVLHGFFAMPYEPIDPPDGL